MDNALTIQDLDILVDALDAWIDVGFAGEIMGDIASALFSSKDDLEGAAKIKREREIAHDKREADKTQRKRTATILKAKLYELQAQADADGIIQSMTGAA